MSRGDDIARAFLLWLADQAHEPDPLEFLITRQAEFDEPMMPAELEPVVTHIDRLGLLRGESRADANMPGRLGLTQAGRECVNHYDGHIASWLARQ